MYCIFNEQIVAFHGIKHARQFREDEAGNIADIFPLGRATIQLDESGNRYSVKTPNGEMWTIGNGGIDEAISRINYAQPCVNIFVLASDGVERTLEEHRKVIAPVLFNVTYSERREDGAIFIAMEAVRNGRKLGEWAGRNVDIKANIDGIMEKQKRRGVKESLIQWGRSPLPGFEIYASTTQNDLTDLSEKAISEKENDRNGKTEDRKT